MKKIGLLIMILGCTIQMNAQAFGELYQAKGKYEKTDSVYVTKYVDGVPAGRYMVTGDDKLRIMKAIGFILDVYEPEKVKMMDAITTRQPYAYLRNVAPMDKGVVYEAAPFLRYQMAPYGEMTGYEPEKRSHIGGILIHADKNDSTVVLGTVNRTADGKDTLFTYPLQYVKAMPVKGEATLDEVQALREVMKKVDGYAQKYVYYGTRWELLEHGFAKVSWYKDGLLKRKTSIRTVNLMSTLNHYLRTLLIDETGRGYGGCIVLPHGYKVGMTTDDFTRDTHNRYKELIKEDCVIIEFPGRVDKVNCKGLLIQLGKTPARVYGLTDDGIVGAPFLYYTKSKNTRKFNAWLKKNCQK